MYTYHKFEQLEQTLTLLSGGMKDMVMEQQCSDGLSASPQMFPSVVFKSGNNGPAVLGGAGGGPSDPSGLGPLGGQTLP